MLIDYIWQFVIVCIISYFIGNINFAVIISNAVKHDDIRRHGSGNPGTTNMMRVFGIKVGALTLICDVIKGIIPVLISYLVFKAVSDNSPEVYRFAMYLSAFCTTVGHVFPVFMKFKGGKGFATSIGVLLFIQPIPTLIILLVGFIIILFNDRMSVFALFYITMELVFHILVRCGIFTNAILPSHDVTTPMVVVVALMWCLVFCAHRTNIARLIKGTESPSGLRRSLFGKKDKKPQEADSEICKTTNDGEHQNLSKQADEKRSDSDKNE